MTAPQHPVDARGRPLVGVLKAAELLGVHERTVVRWAVGGTLEVASRTAGGHRRFRLADVTALRDKLAQDANPDAEQTIDPDQLTIPD